MRSAVRGAVLVLLLAGAAGFLNELGGQLRAARSELLWEKAMFVAVVGALCALGPAVMLGGLLRVLRARPDGRCAAAGALVGALLIGALVAAAPRFSLAGLLQIVPIGAVLGVIAGLVIGILRAARSAAPEEPATRSEAPAWEGGLPAHELALASARALALAPLLLLLLMAVTGGPRALVNLVQEVAPWTLGDLHARFMIGGSVVAGCLAMSCAYSARRPSSGELGRAQRATGLLSGFVVGVLGLPVVSILLLGR